MLRKFPIALFLSSCTPLLSVAGEMGKKTFYPASSLYFWILAAGIFYIAYLYHTSKNQKLFFNSTFVVTTSYTISILFLSFFSINIFLTDPLSVEEKIASRPTVHELLKKDKELAQQAEADFTNIDLQIHYISSHYQMPATWEGKYETEARDDFTIVNYYSDKLSFTDTSYVDMGKFGLALCNYQAEKYREAKEFLDQISDRNFPYLNYYKGNMNILLHDTTLAIKNYKSAISVKDQYTEEAYMKLVSIWESKGNNQELLSLLYNPQTEKYISSKLATRLYFEDFNLTGYYKTVLAGMYKNVKLTGSLAAFVIMLVWLYYMVRIDIFEKESYASIALTLITGMITTLFCFYLYDILKYQYHFSLEGNAFHKLLYAVFGIGLIEESVKIIPLLLILLFIPKIVNEAYDYILYACISALGFAFMENLLYFDGDLAGIIHGRAMLSVPGHMMDSSIVAYGFVLSRYRYQNFPVYLAFPVFLFLGAVSHGLYDYWLFIHAMPVFYLYFLISASIWIIILNNCMNNSPLFTYKLKFQRKSIQIYMGIALISVLILQYSIVAWEEGPSYANRTFNGSLLFGGIFITYYLDKLTNMDLVKGYWNTISLTTIEDKRRGDSFNLKSFFLRLIAGDIISHSFVGAKVFLQCDHSNPELLRYFNHSVKAEIIDRLIVNCKTTKDKTDYKDPYWFRLKTQTPISTGAHSEQNFILKFEDSQPSFRKSDSLPVYLYCFKAGIEQEEVRKDELRPLGRVYIKPEN
jgi:RsiW-degrading membrane proteinase PrsW (M82 family)